jgi:stress response protein YsnF
LNIGRAKFWNGSVELTLALFGGGGSNMSAPGRGRGKQASELVIPVFEEEARIEKRQVATGRLRVRTVAEIVEEIVGATLEEENVEVIRVPIDRVVTKVPAVRTKNRVTIVPVLEEVLVVEKQLVLREELHIRRSLTREKVKVPIKLRRQRAVVERVGAAENPARGSKQ